VNLDYQRSKVHILGQLNCWQVWQQGLECGLLCFALLVFCLSPCGYRQFLAGNCPCERNGGICLDLASGTGFGSLLNPHERVKVLLLLHPWMHSKMLLSTKLSFNRVGWYNLLRTPTPMAKGHWAKCWSNLVLVLHNNLLFYLW